MNTLKRFLSPLILAAILSTDLPASAVSSPNNQLSETSQQVRDFFSDIRDFVLQLSLEFSQGFGEASREVQVAVESSLGVMGIADPVEVERKIAAAVSKQNTKTTETSATVQGNNAKHTWSNQYSKVQSELVLSKKGQDAMQGESDIVHEAAQASAQEAEQAESDSITQDLLRRQVRQNALALNASEAIQRQTQLTNRLLAVNTNILSNIAEREEGNQRQKDIETQIEIGSALQAAGFQNGFWSERQTNGGN